MKIFAYVSIALITTTSGLCGMTVVVPSPSKMILDSEIILEGQWANENGGYYLSQFRALKGVAPNEKKVELIAEGMESDESLRDKILQLNNQRCIVLGKSPKEGKMEVGWGAFGIWPLKANPAYFKNRSLEQLGIFIRDVIKYMEMSEREDELIGALLSAVKEDSKRLAALGFLDACAIDLIKNEVTRKGIVGLVALELITRDAVNAQVVQIMLGLHSQMPPTAAYRYMMRAHAILSSSSDPDDKEAAKNALACAASTLCILGLAKQRELRAEPDKLLDRLRQLAEKHLADLSSSDAENALEFFSAKNQTLRDNAGILLGFLLQVDHKAKPASSMTPEEISGEIGFWKSEIEKKRAPVNAPR